MVDIPASEWRGSSSLNFIPFNDLITCKLAECVTADIIGRITYISPEKAYGDSGEESSKYITLELKDLEGANLSCTLWSKYKDDFLAKREKVGDNECVILLIQFGRTKKFDEQLTVRLDWTFTRILINPNCVEANDFIKSILETHANSEATESLAPSSEPAEDPVEAWFKHTKSIECVDLPFCDPGVYVVHAKIISVLPDDPWWYIGCKKHHKKASPEVENIDLTLDVDAQLALPRKCVKCVSNPSVALRYKVSVRIEDLTDTATVTLFETQVCKFVTKSAYELQISLPNCHDFPDDLDVLIGNKLLFKLDVSNYNVTSVNPNYTVKDAMSEAEFVDKYKTKLEAHKAMNDDRTENSHDAKPTPSVCTNSQKCGSTQTSVPLEVGSNTSYTPPKKIIKQEPSGSPVSAKSTTSKAKRNLNANAVPLNI
ncbi:uncharacterized protein [Rutidosis leptorrhynchoides]|uniref:uncharacterized protein n=1 Tax=Rutidosis leptorrhynchoides TaxID=125765 RepID=UPI003A99BD0F